ncbi:hypothetical protein ACEWY4_014759 [Coilia grayii]|uniref:Uncharacterized protein n=1 Tax=Coilia grayii TaxID=363190 RepID=A0ABD1JT71_9TELE
MQYTRGERRATQHSAIIWTLGGIPQCSDDRVRHFTRNNGGAQREAVRLREPSACLSWAEGSLLASMAQSQASQNPDILSPDVLNQLLEMLDQSAFHSVQPIELNFSESPANGSPSNTIQISMDCITMREAEEPYTVRGVKGCYMGQKGRVG